MPQLVIVALQRSLDFMNGTQGCVGPVCSSGNTRLDAASRVQNEHECGTTSVDFDLFETPEQRCKNPLKVIVLGFTAFHIELKVPSVVWFHAPVLLESLEPQLYVLLLEQKVL